MGRYTVPIALMRGVYTVTRPFLTRNGRRRVGRAFADLLLREAVGRLASGEKEARVSLSHRLMKDVG